MQIGAICLHGPDSDAVTALRGRTVRPPREGDPGPVGRPSRVRVEPGMIGQPAQSGSVGAHYEDFHVRVDGIRVLAGCDVHGERQERSIRRPRRRHLTSDRLVEQRPAITAILVHDVERVLSVSRVGSREDDASAPRRPGNPADRRRPPGAHKLSHTSRSEADEGDECDGQQDGDHPRRLSPAPPAGDDRPDVRCGRRRPRRLIQHASDVRLHSTPPITRCVARRASTPSWPRASSA
jgi:hypothetical protein